MKNLFSYIKYLQLFFFVNSISVKLMAQKSDTTYFWSYSSGQKSYSYKRKGNKIIEKKWTESALPTLYRKAYGNSDKGGTVTITYYENGKKRWKNKESWKVIGNPRAWNAFTGKPKRRISVSIHWDENGKKSRTKTVTKNN